MVRAVIRVPYTNDSATPGGDATTGLGSRSESAGRYKLMSKVPSLMFDMEDTEEGAAAAAAAARDDTAEGDVVHELASLLAPCGDQEYMLSLHIQIARDEASKRGHPHVSAPELADTLRRVGYVVKLRNALGGGWGGACLRNLRHSFVVVALRPGADGSDAEEVIVDPRFLEQFQIAHATPRYSRILAAVPAEAAIPRQRLHRTVEILCAEMARSFCETSTALPPWRQTAAMLSKWMPRRSEEVDMTGVEGPLHDTLAAMVNNAGGFQPTARQAAHNNNTVAHKLAVLGVRVTGASPISEGQEEGDSMSSGADEPGLHPITALATSASSADASPGEVTSMQHAALDVHLPSTATAAMAAGPPRHVWEGIQQAVAAMPSRRNTWA